MASSRARFLRSKTDQNENNLAKLGIRLPQKKNVELGEQCQEIKKPLNLVNKKVIANSKNAAVSKPSLKEPSKPVQIIEEKQSVLPGIDFSKLHVRDIDKLQINNILLQGEYAADIFDYLRTLEVKYPVRKDYLSGQAVTPRMRAVLVDHLVDVHYHFKLVPETLYLTVNIFDRFLQDYRIIQKKNVQLVGLTAMLMACKYEEVQFPSIMDFVYMSDGAFTRAEVIKMEMKIAKQLAFSFNVPLPPHFLRRYSNAISATPEEHALAKYFMELTVGEFDMCHIKPSLIAAGAIYLSLYVLSNKDVWWSDVLIYYSKYSERDVKPVAKQIVHIIAKQASSKLEAVLKKYESPKFLSVSVKKELQSKLKAFL